MVHHWHVCMLYCFKKHSYMLTEIWTPLPSKNLHTLVLLWLWERVISSHSSSTSLGNLEAIIAKRVERQSISLRITFSCRSSELFDYESHMIGESDRLGDGVELGNNHRLISHPNPCGAGVLGARWHGRCSLLCHNTITSEKYLISSLWFIYTLILSNYLLAIWD